MTIRRLLHPLTHLTARLLHFRVISHRVGWRKAVFKIVKNGAFKRWENYRAHARIGARYPQHTLIVIGMPKSGSTWLADMLESVPGFAKFTPVGWHGHLQVGGLDEHAFYPEVPVEFRRKLAIIKGHTWGNAENVGLLRKWGLKYLITLRDPRDALISEYWYVRQIPFHLDHRLARENSLGDYIEFKLSSGAYNAKTLNWMRQWLDGRDPENSIVILYEKLIDDTERWLQNSLNLFQIALEVEELKEIVGKHEFEKITGRKRGSEDHASHVRRGQPGEWETVFTPQSRQIFAAQGEDIIRRLNLKPTLAAAGFSEGSPTEKHLSSLEVVEGNR